MPDNDDAEPRDQANNESDELSAHTKKMIKAVLFISLLTIFAPLHIWGVLYLSWQTIISGYFFAVIGLFYGMASVILLLGVMVPPIMLGHWIWEVWNEPVPVEEQAQNDEN